jgi:hypothetical protein
MSHTRETNTEFITRLMEFSPAGALAQVMIIQAIDTFTREVAKAPLDDLRGGSQLVSAECWQATAQYLQLEMTARLGQPD